MIASWLAVSLKSFCMAALLAVVMVLATHSEPLAQATPSDIVTQGEFAAYLVRELGWQAGLPAEPKTADYLAVLSGKRTFRFEAEDVFNTQGDSVTVRNYPLHGPFSGTGWLSGTAMPTTVRFSVFLPRGGEYLLKVVLRGDGQRWLAGDRELTVKTGGSLREAEAGTVLLNAGVQEILVQLPPEGGVDAFTLHAVGDHPAIEPLEGWRPDAPLSWGDYAETIAAALDLEKGFSASGASRPRIVSFHNGATLPSTAVATTADYLGAHVAPTWVRAGSGGALIDLPLDIPVTGVYAVRVRLLGETLITDFNGKHMQLKGKPYLDWYDIGVLRLQKGTHILKVQLPSLGGADAVEISSRPSSPADYLSALGLGNMKPKATISRAELEAQLRKDLSRIRPSR
ncbi:hypothetical protein GEOBC_01702 [Geobacteraceae bacterium]|nr:hypothetical protein GEOBC_01702 [Geobacteraceae bacterium]